MQYSDGTSETPIFTIDLETGKLGDGFIIPANLNSGDTFYDKNEGNITIDGVEERTYSGATRTVIFANISQNIFYWDKPTGVLVEASLASADFTLQITADRTNMWQAQLFGLEPVVVYALIIAVIAVVAIVAFLAIHRRNAS